MTKVVRIGTINVGPRHNVNVFASIEVKDGKLSICGVEGPLRSGNAIGSCGQIVMSLKADDFTDFAPGWDREKADTFLQTWDRWHLNHMRPGSPAQGAYLREHPIESSLGYYKVAVNMLTLAGLNPDPNFLHDGKPYLYGHAWIREEVPSEVLDFLSGLPDTDITPAWV